jgi:hypothetical protein
MSGGLKMKIAIFDKKYWDMFSDYLLENIDCEIFTVQKKSHIYYSGNLMDFQIQ